MNKQSGISLIEIMIALLIGLFLLDGVLQLFSSALCISLSLLLQA